MSLALQDSADTSTDPCYGHSSLSPLTVTVEAISFRLVDSACKGPRSLMTRTALCAARDTKIRLSSGGRTTPTFTVVSESVSNVCQFSDSGSVGAVTESIPKRSEM